MPHCRRSFIELPAHVPPGGGGNSFGLAGFRIVEAATMDNNGTRSHVPLLVAPPLGVNVVNCRAYFFVTRANVLFATTKAMAIQRV
jgi:hypothetical protein